jgi:ATP-dependent helicase HrpB
VYDPHQKRVVCETLKTLGEIPLERNVSHEVADDDAARVLLEKIDAGDIPFPGWDEEVETWITRLNCLSTWRPDWEIPPITPEDRRTLLQHMLASCRTRKDVKQLKVLEHIQDWISPMHRDLLRSECPTRIQLPNGRRAQVRYEEGSPPVVSSKLQDFFGLNETPRIAGGEVICRVELLAPNRRPAALTDQLDRFWKEGYGLVRKDLKGRYPKHDWPETPG